MCNYSKGDWLKSYICFKSDANMGTDASDVNVKKNKFSTKSKKSFSLLSYLLGNYSYNKEMVLGVDITAHYVRVCQMKKSYGKWVFNNLASSCIETQFRKNDIMLNPDLYVENLKDLVAKNKIKTKDVAFTVPTSSSIIKVLSLPDMDDNDFEQAAALGSIWENMVALDGGAANYSISYKILRRNPAKPIENDNTQDNIAISQPVVSDPLASAEESQIPAADLASIAPIDEQTSQLQNTQTIEPQIMPVPQDQQVLQAPEVSVIEGAAPTVDEIATQTADTLQSVPTDAVQTIPTTADANATPQIPAVNDITQTIAPNVNMPEGQATINAEQMIQPIASIDPLAVAPDMTMPDASIADNALLQQDLGPTMDVLFVANKIADVTLYADIIKKAGLNPVVADISCLSLKHAFESNKKNLKEVSQPFAFMEFGPDENYIFVIDGDNTTIYDVIIPDDNKNAIVSGLDNEQVLLQFVQNFVAQSTQILENHEKQYKTAGINSIFVSSSAPRHVDDASAAPLIKSFVKEISKQMGNRRISECNFCDHIVVPEKFAKQVNAEGNISAWAPTIGIATRRLDIFDYEKNKDPVDGINLLPDVQNYKKNKRAGAFSMLLVAFIFVFALVGVGLSYVFVNNHKSNLVAEVKSMDKVEESYNDKFSESTRLTLFLKKMNSLDSVKNSLPSNQSSILAAYKKITDVIPEGVWLEEVVFTKPNKIGVTGNSINDNSILRFVNKLNEGSEFIKMSLKEMEMEIEKKKKKDASASDEVSTVKKFTIVGFVKGNVIDKRLEILTSEAKKK